ncbi:unnamed protein product, partial [Ixodes pacificus]
RNVSILFETLIGIVCFMNLNTLWTRSVFTGRCHDVPYITSDCGALATCAALLQKVVSNSKRGEFLRTSIHTLRGCSFWLLIGGNTVEEARFRKRRDTQVLKFKLFTQIYITHDRALPDHPLKQ